MQIRSERLRNVLRVINPCLSFAICYWIGANSILMRSDVRFDGVPTDNPHRTVILFSIIWGIIFGVSSLGSDSRGRRENGDPEP
jgi:hypothetical protein